MYIYAHKYIHTQELTNATYNNMNEPHKHERKKPGKKEYILLTHSYELKIT